MQKILKLLPVLWLAGFAGCLNVGCALFKANPEKSDKQHMQNQEQLDTTLAALEKARFRGNITLDTGGSPLAVHQRASVWLGPGEQTLRIAGEVDFQNAPRAGTGSEVIHDGDSPAPG